VQRARATAFALGFGADEVTAEEAELLPQGYSTAKYALVGSSSHHGCITCVSPLSPGSCRACRAWRSFAPSGGLCSGRSRMHAASTRRRGELMISGCGGCVLKLCWLYACMSQHVRTNCMYGTHAAGLPARVTLADNGCCRSGTTCCSGGARTCPGI